MPELEDLRYELFAQEYLQDLCGAATCRRIKLGVPSRAKRTAWEVLQRPEVRARIKELIADREANSPVRRYRAIEELAAIATSSIAHFKVNPKTGRLQIAKGAPNRAMAAVKVFKQKTRTIQQGKDVDGNELPPIIEIETELRMHDKNPALAKCMEYVGAIAPAGLGSGVTVNVGVTAVVELSPEERLNRLKRLNIPVALPAVAAASSPVPTPEPSRN